MVTAVPVSYEIRETLREICREKETSYDELLKSMIEEVDVASLDVKGVNHTSKNPPTKSERQDADVKNQLKNNGVDGRLLEKCMELVDGSYSNGNFLRSNPKTIAAGAEYAARLLLNEKHTQQQVAHDYDTTIVTIRKTYQQMLEDDPSLE